MGKKSKKTILSKLIKQIKNCKKCNLHKTRTNPVIGFGNLDTRIMICGEAPGREEDLKGFPFTGRAGKLLDRLFVLADLKRENMYIANILKCRPPKNRKPTLKEIRACLPYLKKQIEIINPEKFILLGEVAFKVFFPEKKLKDFRGKLVKKDGKEYFITYHPAAGVRFQKNKRILERDFRKFKFENEKRV